MVGRRNWMLAQARHYANLRSAYPTDRLLVMFEIDGPIVDQRHWSVTHSSTAIGCRGRINFRGVEVTEVEMDAGNLEHCLIRRGLPAMVRRPLPDWHREQPSSPEQVRGTEGPYSGVLEVIRWFQLQRHDLIIMQSGPRSPRPQDQFLFEMFGDSKHFEQLYLHRKHYFSTREKPYLGATWVLFAGNGILLAMEAADRLVESGSVASLVRSVRGNVQ